MSAAPRLPQRSTQGRAAAAPARSACKLGRGPIGGGGALPEQQRIKRHQQATTRSRGLCSPRARASRPDDAGSAASHGRDDEQVDTPTAVARRPTSSTALLAASMAAAAAALAATPPPARAADAAVSWKPRRHHRHIGERFTDRWADAVAEAEEQGRERVRDLERRLAAANARADGEAATRQAAEARLRALQQRAEAAGGGRGGGAYGSYDEWPVALRVLGADVTPLLLAAAAVFAWWRAYSSGALAEWTGGRVGARGGRGRRRAGRWVYDRSLGGKRVWVPEAAEDDDNLGGGWASSGAQRAAGNAGAAAAIMSDADFDALAARAANASVAVGATALSAAAASSAAKQPASVPAWWEAAQPRRLAGLDARTKAEARAEAQRVLRRLEQAKNAGEDYAIEGLLALRRACQQAGTPPAGEGKGGAPGAIVEARTVGGRDALFRAAVDAAVRAAGEPGSVDLGGDEPLRLCAAVAGDLGLADARAISVVRGRLAGAARARVVEAIAALGRGDGEDDGDEGSGGGGDGDALLALDKLASLLEGMPGVLGGEPVDGGGSEGAAGGALEDALAAAAARAAPVAPEVELVASELNKWAPVPSRERVLALYCQLDPSRAALVARMLDFAPEVALPRVARRLAEARRQQDGGRGGGGGGAAE